MAIDEKDLNQRIRFTKEGRHEIRWIRNSFYTGVWSNRYTDPTINKKAGAFVRRKQLRIKSREDGTRFTVDPYNFLSNLNKETFREYFSGLKEARYPFSHLYPLYQHYQGNNRARRKTRARGGVFPALKFTIRNEDIDLLNHLQINLSEYNCKIIQGIDHQDLVINGKKDKRLLICSQEGTSKSWKNARFMKRRTWNLTQNAKMRQNWMGLYNDGIVYDHSTFRYYIAGMLDSGINFTIKGALFSKPVVKLSSYHDSGRIAHVLEKLFMGRFFRLGHTKSLHIHQFKWQAIYSHTDSQFFPAKLRYFIPFIHSSIRNRFIHSFSTLFAIRSGWFHPNHFAFPIYLSLLSFFSTDRNLNLLRPGLRSNDSLLNTFFHYPYRKEIVPAKAKLINQAFDPTMLTDPLYIMFGQKAREDMLARYEKEINEYYAGRPQLRIQHEKEFKEHLERNKGTFIN